MHKKGMLILALTLFTSGAVFASNDWNNYQGNAAHTGYVPVQSDPAAIYPLWTQDVLLADKASDEGKYIHHHFGGVAVVDGTVYFSFYGNQLNQDNISVVSALDTKSGNLNWRKVIDRATTIGAPLFANGKILVAGSNGGSANLIALDTAKGVAAYELIFDNIKPFDPQVFQNNIYLRSSANASLNTDTGKIDWTNNTTTSANFNPAISDDYIMFPMHHGLEVLDRKTGTAAFTIDADGAFSDELRPIYPIYDNSRHTAYVTLASNNNDASYSLYALDLQTHKMKWQSPEHYYQASMADNEIYEVDYDSLLSTKINAYNAETGEIAWSWHGAGLSEYPVGSRPLVVTKDLIFVSSPKYTLGISRVTHKVVWKSPKTGLLAIGDNKLFIVDVEDTRVTVSAYALS